MWHYAPHPGKYCKNKDYEKSDAMWRYALHPGKHCKYKDYEKVMPCGATRYTPERIVNKGIME